MWSYITVWFSLRGDGCEGEKQCHKCDTNSIRGEKAPAWNGLKETTLERLFLTWVRRTRRRSLREKGRTSVPNSKALRSLWETGDLESGGQEHWANVIKATGWAGCNSNAMLLCYTQTIRNHECLLGKGEQSSYIKITAAVWRMDWSGVRRSGIEGEFMLLFVLSHVGLWR